MNQARDTIHIYVEYFTGQEEGEDDVGYPYYVASCDEIVAVTDGRTWNELMKNIQEMIDVALDEDDTVEVYNIVSNYAEIA
jgi:predicted RNase H-like HicB family nuclease